VIRIPYVDTPELHHFPAPPEKATGACIIICPGGGYGKLAWNKEGTEVATWLNTLGVEAVVLKYRVPRRKNREKHDAPLQDAQRAVSLVRHHAKEWGLDPKRIGVLGFSAGGHLSATALTNYDKRHYKSVDAVDKASCRPDFGVLIYPAYLVDKETKTQLSPELRITKNTPPIFFAHAGDDATKHRCGLVFIGNTEDILFIKFSEQILRNRFAHSKFSRLIFHNRDSNGIDMRWYTPSH